jgi:hypothetical protein
VAEIAERLGKPFAPHQRHMADVALEIDPETGRLAYGEVVIIGPRQVTGKTEFLLPYATHRCVGFSAVAGPQRVLWTAQTADEARKRWRDVHLPRLQSAPTIKDLLRKPRLRLNQEAMFWRNGSVWSPGSTTGKTSGTGDTLDLAIIDEAWSHKDSRTELGLRPAMMTRSWAQLMVASMIPGLTRAQPGTWPYLKGKRDIGRARVAAGVRRGVAFFDFAAEDGLDPADPETWWSCMPMLGRTVTVQRVRDDFEALPLVDFCAEYLGWEPVETTPRWTLIPEAAWEDRRDPSSAIEGTPALAIEVNEDRDRAWIGAAGRRPDGHWHVEVVEPGQLIDVGTVGIDWVERRAADIWDRQDPCTVVIDPRRPASSLIVPLRNRGIDVLTPSQVDIAGACGRFYDAAGGQPDPGEERDQDEEEGGLWVYHLGQAELDRALGIARRVELPGGAFTFVRRGTAGELGPLYSGVLAMHGHAVKAPVDYDVLDSVDSTRPCGRCGRMMYEDDGVWWHADDSPAC